MKIAITGMSGFVGVNLYEHLNVVFPHSQIVGISRKTREGYLSYETFYETMNDFDVVIHLAGKAHDTKQTGVFEDYLEANTTLTRKIFDCFNKAERPQKFIFLSSIKAVIDHSENWLDEAIRPQPKTDYGISKLKAEEHCQKEVSANKEVFILRPAMIHGRGNKGNLNLLYKFAQTPFPYPLSSFSNKRSFLSIDNLIFVIEKIIESHVLEGIYHLADDEVVSTKRVFEIMKQELKKKYYTIYFPKRIIGIICRIGDILGLPLNTHRLKKMTENFLVSNHKIKSAISEPFPLGAEEGLRKTIRSFIHG